MKTTTTSELGKQISAVPAATPTSKARKILIALGLLVLLGAIVLALLPPLIIGGMVNQHITFSETWTAAEYGLESEKLTLTTSDGLHIVAYEVAAEQPKAIIIFLSGLHNPSVTAFFGHARLLHDHGYASVLVEMRARGESDGEVIGLGYKEVLDVQAAVDYIKGQSRYADAPIVVYGLSMGGGAAINAIGQIPDIDGLIALSAFSAWDELFVDHMGAPEPIGTLQRPFVRLYTGIKYGWDSRHITPRQQIQNLGDRPALLIHSTADSQVPYANFERLMAVAPAHVESWVRQGDLHFIVKPGSFLQPQEDTEYAGRILSFLDSHFGSAVSAVSGSE